MLLSLGEPTINYETYHKQQRPGHCMVSCKVYDCHQEQKYLLVVDYYTPLKKRAGWWVALRKPGYVPRLRPQYILFIKEGYDAPTLSTINILLQNIFLKTES